MFTWKQYYIWLLYEVVSICHTVTKSNNLGKSFWHLFSTCKNLLHVLFLLPLYLSLRITYILIIIFLVWYNEMLSPCYLTRLNFFKFSDLKDKEKLQYVFMCVYVFFFFVVVVVLLFVFLIQLSSAINLENLRSIPINKTNKKNTENLRNVEYKV